MKYLLYYNLDNKFVIDQTNVGGDGTNVVSVVDGVAWTKDRENTYYRYAKPDSENLTSYTITIHYKDINGDSIAPDDVVTVDGYVGKKVSETITAKRMLKHLSWMEMLSTPLYITTRHWKKYLLHS